MAEINITMLASHAQGSMWRMCAPMFTPANPPSRKNEGVKGVSGKPTVYIPTSDAFAIASRGIPACWATCPEAIFSRA
jgi:hypothetical protein